MKRQWLDKAGFSRYYCGVGAHFEVGALRHSAKASREWHLTELQTHGARADQCPEPVKGQNRGELSSMRDSRMKSDFIGGHKMGEFRIYIASI